jgi:hypothetical protein
VLVIHDIAAIVADAEALVASSHDAGAVLAGARVAAVLFDDYGHDGAGHRGHLFQVADKCFVFGDVFPKVSR